MPQNPGRSGGPFPLHFSPKFSPKFLPFPPHRNHFFKTPIPNRLGLYIDNQIFSAYNAYKR